MSKNRHAFVCISTFSATFFLYVKYFDVFICFLAKTSGTKICSIEKKVKRWKEKGGYPVHEDNAIITAAITGAVHIPSISEYLPITPQQIIDQAVGAAEAGAAVVHIHGRRKEDGMPTGDPEVHDRDRGRNPQKEVMC